MSADFRAIAHPIPDHGVLVRLYSRLGVGFYGSGWRSIGQIVLSRAEWAELKPKLDVLVFEGVGRGERIAQ